MCVMNRQINMYVISSDMSIHNEHWLKGTFPKRYHSNPIDISLPKRCAFEWMDVSLPRDMSSNPMHASLPKGHHLFYKYIGCLVIQHIQYTWDTSYPTYNVRRWDYTTFHASHSCKTTSILIRNLRLHFSSSRVHMRPRSSNSLENGFSWFYPRTNFVLTHRLILGAKCRIWKACSSWLQEYPSLARLPFCVISHIFMFIATPPSNNQIRHFPHDRGKEDTWWWRA